MDPLVALVVTAAASASAVVLVVLLAVVLRRRARARQAAYERRLSESAAQIERLGEQVEELSADVARAEAARRTTARAARAEEYVITTLADTIAGAGSAAAQAHPSATRSDEPARTSVARVSRHRPAPRVDLEGHLVGALARQHGTTAVRARAAEIVVHGVALAHGVRRALRPDALDRAAAEAHVARRRSRRLRRAEIREARKLVRVLRDVA
jgi:hypothetical protein